jgi:hypothetical protein
MPWEAHVGRGSVAETRGVVEAIPGMRAAVRSRRGEVTRLRQAMKAPMGHVGRSSLLGSELAFLPPLFGEARLARSICLPYGALRMDAVV